MFNIVWPMMLMVSMVVAMFNGKIDAVAAGILTNAKLAIEIVMNLFGIMAFWLGLMRVAEKAGLVDALVARLRPLLAIFFPDIPKEHPSFGLIVMSVASSMLGLSNASTPVSIRAMQAMQNINKHPAVASNAMCLFMVINSSSVQLIPATTMAVLSGAGASEPTRVVLTGLVATTVSTFASVIACVWMQGWRRFRVDVNRYQS